MSEPASPAAAAPAKKGGAMKWIVIGIVLLLVLGGGGGAAWWFLLRKPPEAAEEGEKAEKTEKAGKSGQSGKSKGKAKGDGIVPMEQFLVNLADKDAQRFVRVTLRLVVETKEEAKEIEENEVVKTRLRSAILELLTQQTAEQLTTPEGKEELKKAIAERCGPAMEGKEVLDVLFTDFVVQF
jgi:flagellar protein FliL